MSYIQYKKKKRKQPLRAHTGKAIDYCMRVATAGGEYGENRKSQAAKEYAVHLYDLAFNERMLFQAHADLKGDAPGVDGIPVEDLGRYHAYVLWANYCQIPFKKRPPYDQTVFPTADPRLLALLSLFYNPEHMFRLKGISFSGAREALPTLQEMGPLCSENKAKQLVKQFQGDNPLSYEVYGDLCQNVPIAPINPGALYNAGMTETGLAYALSLVPAAIKKALTAATTSGIKDKILDFTPLKWLSNADAAKTHLTWDACRWINGLLAGGSYRPQKLRESPITSSDGRKRILNLPTVVDRTVERAAFMTIEPMLEKRFRPSSVGCRYELDRFDALAALSNHYPNARGKYILCADIRKAFDNVRHVDLLASLKKIIPDPKMLRYLEMVITRPGTNRGDIGIHQGGPLSPMFLNVLLHEHLDQPFLKCLRSDLVYLRYVDDLAVFGFESEAEGQALLELLQGLLKPISLALHTDPPKTQIVNLAEHRLEFSWNYHPSATLVKDDGIDRYLGLGLCGNAEGRLEFFLPRSWPERIADMYHRADAKIDKAGYSGTEGARTHILHATESWLEAFAPAWRESWQHEVTEQIVAICRQESNNSGNLDSETLVEEWENSYKRWLKRCAEVQTTSMQGWRFP